METNIEEIEGIWLPVVDWEGLYEIKEKSQCGP